MIAARISGVPAKRGIPCCIIGRIEQFSMIVISHAVVLVSLSIHLTTGMRLRRRRRGRFQYRGHI